MEAQLLYHARGFRCFAFAAFMALATTAMAAWSPDPTINTPVCTTTGAQFNAQLVSDGAGGGIITWTDRRAGNADIYAQRLDANGNPQWAANGVPVCTATGDQFGPSVIVDGAGGVIMIWQDERVATDSDIYAQRLNSAGVVQWAVNGSAVCTVAGKQVAASLVSDGSGGAIATWSDNRGGGSVYDYGIYAQRITSTGAVQAGWTANGVVVCADTNVFEGGSEQRIIRDGTDGAIICWADERLLNNSDLYAQRISGAGLALWTANGQAVCQTTGSQYSIQMISDTAGGAIVAWADGRAGDLIQDVYGQRISSVGAAQWIANGVGICTAPGSQYTGGIVPDGTGGAIVGWIDQRDESSNAYVYAQRKAMPPEQANGRPTAWRPHRYLLIVWNSG